MNVLLSPPLTRPTRQRAEDLLQAVESGRLRGQVVSLDLFRVPHADNASFRQALKDLVDEFALRFQPDVVDVGGYAQLFLFGQRDSWPLLARLAAVDQIFSASHFAAPHHAAYQLPRGRALLAAFLRAALVVDTTVPVSVPASVELTPTEQARLHSVRALAAYTQVLAPADVSSVMRETPVWRRDAGHWRIAFCEVGVCLDHIARAVGLLMGADPWLVDRLRPLLDQRTIVHFAHEPSRLATPHSLDLLPESVLSPRFQRLLEETTVDQRSRLCVELSVGAFRTMAEPVICTALELLRLWEVDFALDHVPLALANSAILPWERARYLKLEPSWADLPPATPLPDWLAGIAGDRVVLLEVTTRDRAATAARRGWELIECQTPPH